MREVVDGVFELGIGYVHVHLVITDSGVVLVDTGLPGKSARIGKALHGLRRKIGDVTTVLLTHHHADHTGGLAEIRRRSGARVVAHRDDVPYVAGAKQHVVDHPIVKIVGRIMGTPEPATVDDVVHEDGTSVLPGFTALHTPGHTPGHLSYLLDRDGGILFAGDAAAGKRGGRIGSTPKMVSDDLDQQRRSVEKLAGLDFDHAVFGHGPALTGRAVDAFRAYAMTDAR
ncbi:MBL fold metallo-hydrolase [Actinoplanes sp. NPDC051859]|uniref:MBL fold metallo-hydrolase n=1 Tax=Actinoplanes sp. NPDC051859 TaxID=3363909 RepID=UPI00378E1833